ncbi:hypothetical protein [Bacillus gaemokensis]|uniref:Lipoprotein n=1 Tax=Bacillus gaemokensis TaxID=574375 RepID=A0A073KLK8_9BACI|nr:hypothetical protein [Bacillus gaemokensis]KEK23228.1 hypothetical protein BAGA_09850 [Bacillus gaemokensis]KYG29024.1 hypothetical protein AZF08_15055 [Bacillus gaemokensis]
MQNSKGIMIRMQWRFLAVFLLLLITACYTLPLNIKNYVIDPNWMQGIFLFLQYPTIHVIVIFYICFIAFSPLLDIRSLLMYRYKNRLDFVKDYVRLGLIVVSIFCLFLLIAYGVELFLLNSNVLSVPVNNFSHMSLSILALLLNALLFFGILFEIMLLSQLLFHSLWIGIFVCITVPHLDYMLPFSILTKQAFFFYR